MTDKVTKNKFFNFEQVLISEKLPSFALNESKMMLYDYENPFISQKEIIEMILKKLNTSKSNQKQEENLDDDDENDGFVQI